MAEKFRVFDENAKFKFILDNYDSIKWHEEYRSLQGGEFSISATLTGNDSRVIYESVVLGDLIIKEEGKIGIVSSVDKVLEEGSIKIEISGFMLEGMFDRRNLRVNELIVSPGFQELEVKTGESWFNGYFFVVDVVYHTQEPLKESYREGGQLKEKPANSNPLVPTDFSLLTNGLLFNESVKWDVLNKADRDRLKYIPTLSIDRSRSIADFMNDVLATYGDLSYTFTRTKEENDTLYFDLMVYNGKDKSEDVVFSDNGGGMGEIKRLRELATVDNLNNAWAVQMEYERPIANIEGSTEQITSGGITQTLTGSRSNDKTLNRPYKWNTSPTVPEGRADGIFRKESTSLRNYDGYFTDRYTGPNPDESPRVLSSLNEFMSKTEADAKYYSSRKNVTSTRFIEAEVLEGSYKYRRDYNLGDTVTISSEELGVHEKVQISGVVEFYYPDGTVIRDIELNS